MFKKIQCCTNKKWKVDATNALKRHAILNTRLRAALRFHLFKISGTNAASHYCHFTKAMTNSNRIFTQKNKNLRSFKIKNNKYKLKQ